MACGLLGAAAHAQSPANAGSLLQQNTVRKPLPPTQGGPALTPATAVPLAIAPGLQVQVKRFELQGNRLLSNEQLHAALQPHLGRTLGLSELQGLAVTLSQLYADAGWLARCFLPPQDITDGVIRIQIVEARFGGVQLDSTAGRFDRQRGQAMVLVQQAIAQTLNLRQVERALMLINDLPGVSASGSLVAGRADGETALALKVQDLALWGGNVGADNGGARSSGARRLSANFFVNGGLGMGDALNARLSHSEGSDFAWLGFALPLGLDGWRAGINVANLRYRLIGADFSALQARGDSSTLGLDASYPLLRRRDASAWLQLAAERKRFGNSANGNITSRYQSSLASVGVSANVFDEWAGGGATSAALTLSRGRLNLSGSPSFAADAATVRTHGGFTKLNLHASRLQTLTRDLSALLSVSAQHASRNLDSSEKFYLGGPGGVRAYPANEGSGAQGALLNLELRTRLPGGLSVSAFYDWGRVRGVVDQSASATPARNAYQLSGLGVSAGWVGPGGLDLRLSWARRIGSNPNPASTGRDQDGSLTRNRLWLQASISF